MLSTDSNRADASFSNLAGPRALSRSTIIGGRISESVP